MAPVPASAMQKVAVKGVDMDVEGTINGVGVYSFDVDSVVDKPWRKPGADLTDYFNYGFNEDTWKNYCNKQHSLRAESGGKSYTHSHHSSQDSSNSKEITTTSSAKSDIKPSPTRTSIRREYPSPINVIGSIAGRRRENERDNPPMQSIQVVGSESNMTNN